MTSASTTALRMVAVKGSRCMMTAVRNAPIRTVERNTNKIAAVVARLSTTRHVQLKADCGMFQACSANAAAMNMAVEDNIEYQVVSSASARGRQMLPRARSEVDK